MEMPGFGRSELPCPSLDPMLHQGLSLPPSFILPETERKLHGNGGEYKGAEMSGDRAITSKSDSKA